MAKAIPSFALYGEDRASQPRLFAHVETIASRSSLHNWEIVPHRHVDFIQILLVESGQVEVTLDATRQSCHAPLAVSHRRTWFTVSASRRQRKASS